LDVGTGDADVGHRAVDKRRHRRSTGVDLCDVRCARRRRVADVVRRLLAVLVAEARADAGVVAPAQCHGGSPGEREFAMSSIVATALLPWARISRADATCGGSSPPRP